MFPTNSERLIGISDAFSAFVYGYPSSSPRAHSTPNKSVTTLRYTRRHRPIIQAMPVGTYRVQSPGFPKIVYSHLVTVHYFFFFYFVNWPRTKYFCCCCCCRCCCEFKTLQERDWNRLEPSSCLTYNTLEYHNAFQKWAW